MGRSNSYTAQQFIDAMPNTGGIISTIAKNVGCEWHTAKKFIDDYPTVNQAWRNEREKLLDMAESTVYKNIRKGDSQDAKWVLARLGKERGYGDKSAIELTGKDGAPIQTSGTIFIDYGLDDDDNTD